MNHDAWNRGFDAFFAEDRLAIPCPKGEEYTWVSGFRAAQVYRAIRGRELLYKGMPVQQLQDLCDSMKVETT